MTLPTLLVIEDGDEYTLRFQRFLGQSIAFHRVTSLAAARTALSDQPRGLLLDLDFRRTPREELVDDQGRTNLLLGDGGFAPLSEQQGILILRALRAEGCGLPALLFADLPDDNQTRYLESSLAPLRIIPSDESLPSIAAEIRRLATATAPGPRR
jgi:hypothetical protein